MKIARRLHCAVPNSIGIIDGMMIVSADWVRRIKLEANLQRQARQSRLAGFEAGKEHFRNWKVSEEETRKLRSSNSVRIGRCTFAPLFLQRAVCVSAIVCRHTRPRQRATTKKSVCHSSALQIPFRYLRLAPQCRHSALALSAHTPSQKKNCSARRRCTAYRL